MRSLSDLLSEIEVLIIEYAVQLYKSKEETAKALGMSRRGMFNKMKEAGTRTQCGDILDGLRYWEKGDEDSE